MIRPVSRSRTRATATSRQRAASASVGLVVALAASAGLVSAGSAAVADATLTTCASPVALVNGGFEDPAQALPGRYYMVNQSTVPGWETTASDGIIEIWTTGMNGVASPQASQFVELNANMPSALYQDVAVTPGQVLRWQLKHRGRDGVDTMSVDIGPVGGPLVTQQILSDGLAWGTYSGVYTVPADMTVARFSFGAVSTAGGRASIGNFIDDVSLEAAACVTVDETVANLTRTGSNRVGDTLEYQSTATNAGGVAAGSVTISEVLPVGVTLVPGSITWQSVDGTTNTVTDAVDGDAGEYDPATRTVSVRTGSVGVGASTQLRYRVTVDASAADTTLVARSQAGYVEPLSASTLSSPSPGTSVVVTPTADLTVTAALSATLVSGGLPADEPATYLITVTNNGPDVSKSSTVAITLPNLTGRTVTSSAGTCVTTGDQVLCDFGDLPNGATREVVVAGVVPLSTTGIDTFVLSAMVDTATLDEVANDSVTLSTPGADNAGLPTLPLDPAPTNPDVAIAGTGGLASTGSTIGAAPLVAGLLIVMGAGLLAVRTRPRTRGRHLA